MRAGWIVPIAAWWTMALSAQAEDLAIQSFDDNGRLTFNEVATAEVYCVEWTTNLLSFGWSSNAPGITAIPATGVGSRTVTVGVTQASCFYRVTATVTSSLPSAPSDMVLIPGGTNAGTDPDFGAYSLTVSSFYMDRYEVTKALWEWVYIWAIAKGYSFDYAGSGKAANHPVHTVNWYDCVKWCNARSQKEGRPAVYMVNGAVYKTGQGDSVVQTSAAGYRLPSDDEWHYAARGGAIGQRFPWGANINHDHANYHANGSAYAYDTSPYTTWTYHPTYNDGTQPYTSPVGSFAPNGYGLYAMAGNVWEWCFDWYPGYEGSYRVLRGGGWRDDADYCRVAYRYNRHPGRSLYNVGFRAVLPPGQ